MRFFTRAARVPARPALSRAYAGTVPGGDWPTGYEAQVRAAYLGNAVALRAVRIVAEGAGSVVIDVTPELGGGGADSAPHPAARLLGAPLIETIATQLLLHGNAFVQILGDADGMPALLFPLRPERVSVEADVTGWPVACLYRAGSRTQRLPLTQADGRPGLLHLRATHPLDDHYGLGSLGAASGPVAIHNAATRWNKALLDNAARPSGALVYAPGENGATLTADQFDRIRAEMEASFSGSGNAGRPMLLEGGLSWQPLSLTPADMDFINLKAAAAREIALAFGVPPMLLGLPGDNTYANYSEANRALWRLTILPLADRIVAGVAGALAAWWPDLAMAIDLDRIPALAADRQALWAQVADADFLSDDEKRQMLGFAPKGEAA